MGAGQNADVKPDVTIETDTVREVTVIGPGAGLEQAGQGMFADLAAIACSAAQKFTG